jgi:hypothetical protein
LKPSLESFREYARECLKAGLSGVALREALEEELSREVLEALAKLKALEAEEPEWELPPELLEAVTRGH